MASERAMEIEKAKKKGEKNIIKYKANKLCCNIDVHIWYENIFSASSRRWTERKQFTWQHTHPNRQNVHKMSMIYDV